MVVLNIECETHFCKSSINTGVNKSLIQTMKMIELSIMLFYADIEKKQIFYVLRNSMTQLGVPFGPEWKSNPTLEFYTKLSLGHPKDESDEPELYCEHL